MINIRNTMTNMNTDWQGDEYDSIAQKIFSYVDALDNMMNKLRNDFDHYFSITNQEYISTKAKVQDSLNIA